MKFLFLLLILCTTNAQALTITSLNIEWYGRGGTISGTEADEYRDSRLLDFLLHEIPPSDVYVFQEVTAPERLARIFKPLVCQTYESEMSRHQFIVICAAESIFKGADVERTVQLGHSGLRPAMIGHIKEDNEEVIHVIGLHLKAGPQESLTRVAQIEALANSPALAPRTIIIGDFNTFERDRTNLTLNDDELIQNVLTPFNFTQAGGTTPTYLGQYPRTFDRVWVRGVRAQEFKVFGPCGAGQVNSPYNSRDFYERFISDHCAIQVRL